MGFIRGPISCRSPYDELKNTKHFSKTNNLKRLSMLHISTPHVVQRNVYRENVNLVLYILLLYWTNLCITFRSLDVDFENMSNNPKSPDLKSLLAKILPPPQICKNAYFIHTNNIYPRILQDFAYNQRRVDKACVARYRINRDCFRNGNSDWGVCAFYYTCCSNMENLFIIDFMKKKLFFIKSCAWSKT